MNINKRQFWALLILLGLIVAACGKPYQPRTSTDPMTGYEAEEGYDVDPKSDPTYAPNPEFDNFKTTRERIGNGPSPSKSTTKSKPRPVELPIYEQDTPQAAPMTPASPDQQERMERAMAPQVDPSKFGNAAPPAVQAPQGGQMSKAPGSPSPAPSHGPSLPTMKPVPSHKVDGSSERENENTAHNTASGKNTGDKAEISPDELSTPILQPIRIYYNGRLKNANYLSSEGVGYVASSYFRTVHYTTHQTEKVIEYAAMKMNEKFGLTLLINTLSKRGGGYIAGHGSHQNGLDADITFIRVNDNDPSDLVVNGVVSKNFDIAKNYELIRTLVSTNTVSVIFVNDKIKRKLCEYSSRLGRPNEPLQTKIGREEGHTNHLHMRLYCPPGTVPSCRNQDPLRSVITDCP